MPEHVCHVLIVCLASAILGGCIVARGGAEGEPESGEKSIIESPPQSVATPVATTEPSGVESEPVSTDTSLLETDLPEPDPTDPPARPVMQYDCTKWIPIPETVRNGRMATVCDGWARVGGQ